MLIERERESRSTAYREDGGSDEDLLGAVMGSLATPVPAPVTPATETEYCLSELSPSIVTEVSSAETVFIPPPPPPTCLFFSVVE